MLCKMNVLTEYLCSSFSIFNSYFFPFCFLRLVLQTHYFGIPSKQRRGTHLTYTLWWSNPGRGNPPPFPPAYSSTRRALPSGIYPHASIHHLVCNIQYQPPLPSTVKCTRIPAVVEPFFKICIQCRRSYSYVRWLFTRSQDATYRSKLSFAYSVVNVTRFFKKKKQRIIYKWTCTLLQSTAVWSAIVHWLRKKLQYLYDLPGSQTTR